MELSELFRDENLRYYIHGTGRSGDDLDNSITNSIFENGLLMYSGASGTNRDDFDLTSTSHCIGYGSDTLYEKGAYSALFYNPHFNGKRSIIITLPKNYLFPDINYFLSMREAAFTDRKKIFTSKEQEMILLLNNEEAPNYTVLMSEFIVGAFDATTHTFIPNKKYFKNLTGSDYENLYQKVHNNYIHYLKHQLKKIILNEIIPFSLEDFLSYFKNSDIEHPLSVEEISELEEYGLEIIKQTKNQGTLSENTVEYENIDGWNFPKNE